MCRAARCGWLSASGRVIGQTVPRAPMTKRPSGLQLDRSERGRRVKGLPRPRHESGLRCEARPRIVSAGRGRQAGRRSRR